MVEKRNAAQSRNEVSVSPSGRISVDLNSPSSSPDKLHELSSGVRPESFQQRRNRKSCSRSLGDPDDLAHLQHAASSYAEAEQDRERTLVADQSMHTAEGTRLDSGSFGSRRLRRGCVPGLHTSSATVLGGEINESASEDPGRSGSAPTTRAGAGGSESSPEAAAAAAPAPAPALDVDPDMNAAASAVLHAATAMLEESKEAATDDVAMPSSPVAGGGAVAVRKAATQRAAAAAAEAAAAAAAASLQHVENEASRLRRLAANSRFAATELETVRAARVASCWLRERLWRGWPLCCSLLAASLAPHIPLFVSRHAGARARLRVVVWPCRRLPPPQRVTGRGSDAKGARPSVRRRTAAHGDVGAAAGDGKPGWPGAAGGIGRPCAAERNGRCGEADAAAAAAAADAADEAAAAAAADDLGASNIGVQWGGGAGGAPAKGASRLVQKERKEQRRRRRCERERSGRSGLACQWASQPSRSSCCRAV